MKHKFNIATRWRHFSGRKVVENAIFILLPRRQNIFEDFLLLSLPISTIFRISHTFYLQAIPYISCLGDRKGLVAA